MRNLSQSTSDSPNATTHRLWYLRGRVEEGAVIQTFYVKTTPFTVGRRADSSLCLASKVVSSGHAELHLRNGVLFVQDLNSTNGTYVNGEPVSGQTSLTEGDLLQFANLAFRVCQDSPSESKHQTIQEISVASDQAFSLVQFDKLMSEAAVVPFFQPLVRLDDLGVFGFEVLGRSRYFGLQTPREMFGAASRLNMEAELSTLMRAAGLNYARQLPDDMRIFVNTHPVEVVSFALLDSLAKLRTAHPQLRICLEIHEAAVTQRNDMLRLRQTLKELAIELAYDDFGSGQSRLRDLFDVPPDYLKFDMSLIRGIHATSPQQQDFVGGMVQMVRNLGILAIAEGVECKEEHETCRRLGFDLGQGYYYGKPVEAKQIRS